MEQVFAPWRIDWVEREERNPDVEECVFCELPRRDADREHRIVARADDAYVILNNYPYNPGHAMVVPDVHEGDYTALDESTLLVTARLVQRTLEAMGTTLEPDGYNVGYNLGGDAAGGSIREHLHAHVVPRWAGDTNFMPVVADTKVIVEAVEATYERLYEGFAVQDGATAGDGDAAVQVD